MNNVIKYPKPNIAAGKKIHNANKCVTASFKLSNWNSSLVILALSKCQRYTIPNIAGMDISGRPSGTRNHDHIIVMIHILKIEHGMLISSMIILSFSEILLKLGIVITYSPKYVSCCSSYCNGPTEKQYTIEQKTRCQS